MLIIEALILRIAFELNSQIFISVRLRSLFYLCFLIIAIAQIIFIAFLFVFLLMKKFNLSLLYENCLLLVPYFENEFKVFLN